MHRWIYLVLLALVPRLSAAASRQSPFTTCAEELTALFPPPSEQASGPSKVAMAGTAIAVGVKTLSGTSSSVFVYRRGAGGFALEAQLSGAPVLPDGSFGDAVALEQDLLLVGAPLELVQAADSGAAYGFEYHGGSWSQTDRLIPPDAQDEMGFGSVVALDGVRALVSAPRRNGTPGGLQGGAYVFRRAGAGWGLEGTLIPPSDSVNARFGTAADLDGNRAVLGSVFGGRAHVFGYDALLGQWTLKSTLQPGDPTLTSFGRSVALDGDTLVVGAPSLNRGIAYVFEHSSGAWGEVASLSPPSSIPFQNFGSTVFVDGEVYGVGATGGVGAVYLFAGAPRAIQLMDVLRPSFPPFATSGFGSSLSVEGSTLAVGTSKRWSFVFELGPECPQAFCQAKINSLFCYPTIESSGLASLSTAQSFDVTGRSIVPDEIGLLLYGTSGRGNVPFHGGKLCVKAPIVRLFPAKDSGHSGPGLCSGVLGTDFNARIQSGADPALEPGTRVVAQWLYRDPPVDAFGDGLTEALEFVVAP